jgi:hypothetical protein
VKSLGGSLQFRYPINVICFNRPELLKIVLHSIKVQTIPIPEDQLNFWVDGYAGSKDESLNQINRTDETISLIKDAFPNCQVHVSETNLGIARNYWRAEINSFEDLKATSAYFLEEDIVLSPHYFELLMRLDTYLSANSDVSQLSVTGDIAGNLSDPDEYFQTSGHSWGYLLRAWHHFERKPFLTGYIELISKNPYFLRSNLEGEILTYFFSKGVAIAGLGQDSIKDGLKNYFSRISISTIEPWATNIGTVGEHSVIQTPNHNREISHYPDEFPKSFDPKNYSRIFFDGRVKTNIQCFENYLSRITFFAEYHTLTQQHHALTQQHHALTRQHHALTQQHHALTQQHHAIINSTIWRLTKPVRCLIAWVRIGLR